MLEVVRPDGLPVDAPACDPAPLRPPAHNFDDLLDELVATFEVYEGDDATSAVEAPSDAITVASDPSAPFVLVVDVGGG